MKYTNIQEALGTIIKNSNGNNYEIVPGSSVDLFAMRFVGTDKIYNGTDYTVEKLNKNLSPDGLWTLVKSPDLTYSIY